MRLYKYDGSYGTVGNADTIKLISSNVADADEACEIISEQEGTPLYIRIMGSDMENGSYYFDYGYWTNFYILTDEILNRGGTNGDNV